MKKETIILLCLALGQSLHGFAFGVLYMTLQMQTQRIINIMIFVGTFLLGILILVSVLIYEEKKEIIQNADVKND